MSRARLWRLHSGDAWVKSQRCKCSRAFNQESEDEDENKVHGSGCSETGRIGLVNVEFLEDGFNDEARCAQVATQGCDDVR